MTNDNTPAEITVPLAKLVIAPENARADSPPDDDIETLAEQIAGDGCLLQRLNAYRKGKTQFAVYDGRRRMLALKLLAKQDRLPPDCKDGAPVKIGTKEMARQHSLSAGLAQRKFHPAEEYRQFSKLIDDGKSVEDVAKTFGVRESDVVKRLKLARVAEPIFTAFAGDALTLDQVMAYALVDDHDRQLRLFTEKGRYINARAIRAALTEGEVPCTDKRAIFIGADAFEAAGGKITRDLFEEAPDTLNDAGLLDALVDAKLKEAAIAVKAEGWAWVRTMTDYDDDLKRTHMRASPERLDKSDEIKEEESRLGARYDEIVDDRCEDDFSDGELQELASIVARLDEIAAAHTVFKPEDIARGGAVLSLSYDGALEVRRGLVERKTPNKKAAAKGDASSVPHSVHRRMTQIATQALSRDLAFDDAAADIVLTAALAQRAFGFGPAYGVKIGVGGLAVDQEASLPVDHALARCQERFAEQIGETLAETIPVIAAMPPEDRVRLRTLCVAASLDFEETRTDKACGKSRKIAGAIAVLLKDGCSVRDHWTPDDAFFRKLKRDALTGCLAEMGKKGRAYTDPKKSELVAIAVREADANKTWTPEPARFVEAVPETAEQKAAA